MLEIFWWQKMLQMCLIRLVFIIEQLVLWYLCSKCLCLVCLWLQMRLVNFGVNILLMNGLLFVGLSVEVCRIMLVCIDGQLLLRLMKVFVVFCLLLIMVIFIGLLLLQGCLVMCFRYWLWWNIWLLFLSVWNICGICGVLLGLIIRVWVVCISFLLLVLCEIICSVLIWLVFSIGLMCRIFLLQWFCFWKWLVIQCRQLLNFIWQGQKVFRLMKLIR